MKEKLNAQNHKNTMTKHTNAIEYFKKSYLQFIREGDNISAAYELCNIGEVYYDEGNLPEALKYLEDAMEHMQNLEDKRHAAIQLQSMASFYEKINQINLAKKCCIDSIKMLEIHGDERDVSNAKKKLSKYE